MAAIAQLLGTIGLFITIGYLALQVRQSTKLARVAAEQAAVRSFTDLIKPMALDAELDRLYRTGLEDPSALSPDERARFFHIAFQALKGFEAVHSSYRDGVMDEDTWRGWHNLATHYLTTPGVLVYWSRRSDVFSPSFQTFMNSLPRVTHDEIAHLHAPRASSLGQSR